MYICLWLFHQECVFRNSCHILKGKVHWCCLTDILEEENGVESFVSKVGNVNEEIVRKYIKEQEKNDKLEDGRK